MARPITRTGAFACPPDCRSEAGPGYVIWRSDCAHAAHSFRLELQHPPADLRAAFALWDELQRDTPAHSRVLQWETGLEVPALDVPPRFAPVRMLGMAMRRAGEPGVAQGVAAEQLERVAAGAAACHPELGESHLEMLRWLYRGLARRGAVTLAAWEGERAVASVTLLRAPDGQMARFLEVWTAPTHRRQGLASALVRQALTLYPGLAHLLVTEEGSAAHALYGKLGFTAVSRVIYASTER
jgi:ribosomal protein S18 acetylase RimI-like enzyme